MTNRLHQRHQPRWSLFPGLAIGSILFSLVIATQANAQAGGLSLPENGGPINGTAQAGSAAISRNAETAWLNPAGMTRLKSAEILVTVMPFYLDYGFSSSPLTTVSGPDGGNQGGWLPAGAMFVAVPVHERVAVGFSVTSPVGLVLDPQDNWAGRFWTTRSALLTLNVEPSVGVRLSDHWSIGAGVDFQYARFEQDLIGPITGSRFGIDGDDWSVGGSASVLWEPLETTRFGLRYRSEISHDLSGDLTARGAMPVSTSLTIPMSLTLSGYHEFTEQFALMADFGWQDWSAFDRNIITIDGAGAQVELPRNFKDTWTVGLGAHVKTAENWLVTFGGSYVSSAVDDRNRTPDLPVDQQVRVSVGVEYAINQQWNVGANYTFMWLGDNEIDQTRAFTGRIAGDYDAFAHIFGLYASLKF